MPCVMNDGIVDDLVKETGRIYEDGWKGVSTLATEIVVSEIRTAEFVCCCNIGVMTGLSKLLCRPKVVVGAPSHYLRTSTDRNRVMIARCTMAKTHTRHHGSPHSQEQTNPPDWRFLHRWNEFAEGERVLLCVAALSVATMTFFEEAQKRIRLENTEVLFPYAFLPAYDLTADEADAVTRSTKRTGMLSQIAHIHCANDADRGFFQTERQRPPDRSWL